MTTLSNPISATRWSPALAYATSAELIVRSARLRHEGHGLHFSRDYPSTLPEARNTVLVR